MNAVLRSFMRYVALFELCSYNAPYSSRSAGRKSTATMRWVLGGMSSSGRSSPVDLFSTCSHRGFDWVRLSACVADR